MNKIMSFILGLFGRVTGREAQLQPQRVEAVREERSQDLPGRGFHGGEQTQTLPGGGFHGGEQTQTLPGGGFHGGGEPQKTDSGGGGPPEG